MIERLSTKPVDKFIVKPRKSDHKFHVYLYKDKATMHLAVDDYKRANGGEFATPDYAGITLRHTRYQIANDGKQSAIADVGSIRFALPNIGAGVVAHEAAHMALHIWELENPDQELYSDDDEQFAWLLGEIVRLITIRFVGKSYYGA